MCAQRAVFVVNAGSSSLKFQCFSAESATPTRLFRGLIDGIGVRPHMSITNAQGTSRLEEDYTVHDMPDLPAAIARMADWMRDLGHIEIAAMGHRVVHGGPDHADPVRITPDVLAQLASYQELAPLHQPNNLAPIRLATEIVPNVPQIACFDTAFHRNKPAHADCYALPKPLYDQGVRRYGFHGLSYEYIAMKLRQVAPEIAPGRVIVAHLGSGASMCAMVDGQSLDSTMGFTALDGLPMSTRPGQLDPGVVLYLISHKGMSVGEVTDLVYHDAGLKGLSQLSGDMRVLLESDTKGAAFAIDHFVYRCAQHVGMMAASMGGVDGMVFTAGVGENSADIRARIVEKMAWLGAELDVDANAQGEGRISTEASKVSLHVIPTDEEWVIARDTLAALRL